MKADMPHEIEQLLTRLNVPVDLVSELEITCTAFERPRISMKLDTVIDKVEVEVVHGKVE